MNWASWRRLVWSKPASPSPSPSEDTDQPPWCHRPRGLGKFESHLFEKVNQIHHRTDRTARNFTLHWKHGLQEKIAHLRQIGSLLKIRPYSGSSSRMSIQAVSVRVSINWTWFRLECRSQNFSETFHFVFLYSPKTTAYFPYTSSLNFVPIGHHAILQHPSSPGHHRHRRPSQSCHGGVAGSPREGRPALR